MGSDPLTVTWNVPTTMSVAADRLRADAFNLSDDGIGLCQCSLGRNVTIQLTTSSGARRVLRGDEVTDIVVHDVITMTRVSDAQADEFAHQSAIPSQDPYLHIVETPGEIPAPPLPTEYTDESLTPPQLAAVPAYHENLAAEIDEQTIIRPFGDFSAADIDLHPVAPEAEYHQATNYHPAGSGDTELDDATTIQEWHSAPGHLSAFAPSSPGDIHHISLDDSELDDSTIMSTTGERALQAAQLTPQAPYPTGAAQDHVVVSNMPAPDRIVAWVPDPSNPLDTSESSGGISWPSIPPPPANPFSTPTIPTLPNPGPAFGQPWHPAATIAGPSVTIMDVTGSAPFDLADALYIGREPAVPADSPPHEAAFAWVSSPTGAVSATHVRLRHHGGQILVWDMWSANGTVVIPPGATPYRLSGGEEIAVSPGSFLELGDGVRINIGGPHGA